MASIVFSCLVKVAIASALSTQVRVPTVRCCCAPRLTTRPASSIAPATHASTPTTSIAAAHVSRFFHSFRLVLNPAANDPRKKHHGVRSTGSILVQLPAPRYRPALAVAPL